MSRRSKKYYIVLVLLLLVGISIGYAVLNTALNIIGKSNITKNTWNVHFENVQITDGSVTATKVPTIENSTTVDFEVGLNLPGDFYEFTVDVINDGSIDAMIDSVEKTPNLTETQQKYLNYIIEYQNGEQITTKQLVKANEFVRLKVKVEFKKDVTASDLPQTTEILTLGFNVNYAQSDGTGSSVPRKSIIKIVSGDGTQTSDEVCIGEECFYVMYSDETTITMLAKYNLYVGNECTSNSSKSCIPYGDEATGKQDSNMLGQASGQSTRKGTAKFSDTNYWESTVSSYPAYVYDSNSILYSYVENYKTYLSILGVTPSEARLITYEELIDLGCSISSYSCYNAPSWVYATSYWSGSAGDTDSVWIVDSYNYKRFCRSIYPDDVSSGCRPVIVIDKSLL